MIHTIETLRASVERELSSPFEAPPNAAATLDAAESLARMAFVEGEPEARAAAERLLYVIHSRHAFAVPVQAGPGLVWATLMRSKLRVALSGRVAENELTAEAMVQRLDDAVRAADERDHPLLDEITAVDSTRGLVIYTKNWFSSTHGFTAQLFALGQRCQTTERMKPVLEAVIENLTEELDKKAPHKEMRARWPKALGIDYTPESALADPDQTTEAFALQNLRTGLSQLPDPTYGLGSFYTVEANFPPVCRRMYRGLKGRFDPKDIAIFQSHGEMDEEHADEWLRALRDAALSPRERANVVAGGLAQIAVRSEMFKAVRARISHDHGGSARNR